MKFLHEDKWNSLFIPVREGSNFIESDAIKLEINPQIQVGLDLTPRAVSYSGIKRTDETPVEITKVVSRNAQIFTFRMIENYIDLLDWERIYREINNFRLERKYFNIVISKESLKNAMLSDKCYINSFKEFDRINNAEDINTLEELAIILLKKSDIILI